MFVQRRNEKLVENAARANAVVSSLFPRNIRDRFVAQSDGKTATKRVRNLKAFLAGHDTQAGVETIEPKMKPLADLFPDTTVMFGKSLKYANVTPISAIAIFRLMFVVWVFFQTADIAGFTAWTSVREPAQVFTLLESVYQSFDKIAKLRRVFKVRH